MSFQGFLIYKTIIIRSIKESITCILYQDFQSKDHAWRISRFQKPRNGKEYRISNIEYRITNFEVREKDLIRMLNPEHLNPETPKWERISNIE